MDVFTWTCAEDSSSKFRTNLPLSFPKNVFIFRKKWKKNLKRLVYGKHFTWTLSNVCSLLKQQNCRYPKAHPTPTSPSWPCVPLFLSNELTDTSHPFSFSSSVRISCSSWKDVQKKANIWTSPRLSTCKLVLNTHFVEAHLAWEIAQNRGKHLPVATGTKNLASHSFQKGKCV